jgi:hypothetical protein
MTFTASPGLVGSVPGEALAIALNYLELTRQAYPYSETRWKCAQVIADEWNAGKRHRIWLANKAIVAIENCRRQAPISVSVATLDPTGSSPP